MVEKMRRYILVLFLLFLPSGNCKIFIQSPSKIKHRTVHHEYFHIQQNQQQYQCDYKRISMYDPKVQVPSWAKLRAGATVWPSSSCASDTLWLGGFHQDDIDKLVTACLKDRDINIRGVPDWLERQIYQSTITLVLSALHRGLSGLHGMTLWQHQIQVTRLPRRKERLEEVLQTLSHNAAPSSDHTQILEDVADRMLANKHINQPLVPDVLEKQLYTNCLKIVFRILDLLAVSFRLTLCGHDLKLQLDPSDRWSKGSYEEEALQRLAKRAKDESTNTDLRLSSCINELSMEQMKKLARQIGDNQQNYDSRPFWRRWFSPANNEFIAQLHASVYCLILGILDDLLDQSEIQLLSDRIDFDIVPFLPNNEYDSTKNATVTTAHNSTASTCNGNSHIDSVGVAWTLNPIQDREQRKRQRVRPRTQQNDRKRFTFILGAIGGYVIHSIQDRISVLSSQWWEDIIVPSFQNWLIETLHTLRPPKII